MTCWSVRPPFAPSSRAISIACRFRRRRSTSWRSRSLPCAACEDWDEDALFDCVRRAYPYRELTREEYDRILEMLSQGIAAKRGRYGAYLFRDMVNRRLRGTAWSATGGHHQRRSHPRDRAVYRGGAAGGDRGRHAR